MLALSPGQATRVLSILLALLPLRAGSALDLDHVLFRSVRERNDERVVLLLREGMSANLRTGDGTTTLMVAALWGTARSVELLLDHGADPKAANESGATALLWGAGDGEKVRLLLRSGADVHARSALGNTPLLAATAYSDSSEAVQLLCEHGAEISAAALTRAVKSGDRNSVDFLLAELVDSDGLSKFSTEAWHRLLRSASAWGSVETLERLQAHLPDRAILDSDSSGRQPIQDALLAEELETARWLLDHGVKLSGRTERGDVPTWVLATYFESGDPSIAKAILDRGVDITVKNARGETALTWARRRGHRELIELLEKAGVPESADASPKVPDRVLNLHAGNRRETILNAISRSVTLMQRSSEKFLDERKNCVSCHHQNLPGVALSHARDRGIQVDPAVLDRMVMRQTKNWGERMSRTHEVVNSLPVPPRFLGWGLWAFSAIGYPQDLLTDSYVRSLAAIQRRDGRWTAGMRRPPMGGGDILSTALAVRALRDYPIRGHERELRSRVERAAVWLRGAEPAHHQEEVFRLLGLTWIGVPGGELESAASALLEAQRPDGGWAQHVGLTSDAWATGQTLVALQASGHLRPQDLAYRRGVGFLLRTQFDDGSWFVKSRTFPFQKYFESDFPYGDDQWISVGATAWAVMALTLGVELERGAVVRSRNETKLPERQVTALVRSTGKKSADAAGVRESSQASGAVSREAVDFQGQIAAVFSRSCLGCHGDSEPEGEMVVTSRLGLLKGGESGNPAILPGRSDESPLVEFISGTRKHMEMPPLKARGKYPGLTEREISTIRAWIDQGAHWPTGATVGRLPGGSSRKF
jgi:ankyrin repeat protein/mono/diheme cytochrome c family protein